MCKGCPEFAPFHSREPEQEKVPQRSRNSGVACGAATDFSVSGGVARPNATNHDDSFMVGGILALGLAR